MKKSSDYFGPRVTMLTTAGMKSGETRYATFADSEPNFIIDLTSMSHITDKLECKELIELIDYIIEAYKNQNIGGNTK